MKHTKLLSGLMILGLILTGCDKKEEKKELAGDNIKVSNPENPEDHKSNLEQTGLSLADEMASFKDAQTMDVMYNFSSLAESTTVLESEESVTVTKTVKAMTDLVYDDGELADVMSSMKSAAAESFSVGEIWDTISNEIVYNVDIDDFEVVDTEVSDLVIKFPSSETSTSNDASITLYKPEFYDGYFVGKDSLDPQPDKIPSKILMELAVDGTVLMSYTMELSFDGNGYPSRYFVEYVIEEFTLSYELTNDQSKEIAATYSFTHSGNIILEMSAGVNGLWTEENIEDNMVEVTDDWGYSYTEFHVENVINAANSSIQLLNVKMSGKVNVEDMVPELNEVYDQQDNLWMEYNWDSPEYFSEDSALVAQEAEIVRKYTDMKLYYANNGETIALIEPYPYVYTDEDWYGNTYKDVYVEPYFVFSDDSKVDPETYFSKGWDDLITELNVMIRDLNQEYNLMLDEIK
jgi:hypothetical protein